MTQCKGIYTKKPPTTKDNSLTDTYIDRAACFSTGLSLRNKGQRYQLGDHSQSLKTAVTYAIA